MGTWVGEAVEDDPQKKNGNCGEAERMPAKNALFFAPVLGHLDLHAGFMMRIATMVLTRRPRRRRRETHADMPDTGRLFSGRDSSFPESDSTQFPAHAVHPTPLERHAAMFPAGFFRSLWAVRWRCRLVQTGCDQERARDCADGGNAAWAPCARTPPACRDRCRGQDLRWSEPQSCATPINGRLPICRSATG